VPNFWRLSCMRPCVLCGRTDAPADDEHVIPKWARNAFAIGGGDRARQ
jgi:hypothetical protein